MHEEQTFQILHKDRIRSCINLMLLRSSHPPAHPRPSPDEVTSVKALQSSVQQPERHDKLISSSTWLCTCSKRNAHLFLGCDLSGVQEYKHCGKHFFSLLYQLSILT